MEPLTDSGPPPDEFIRATQKERGFGPPNQQTATVEKEHKTNWPQMNADKR
jgi:hypothetical protein